MSANRGTGWLRPLGAAFVTALRETVGQRHRRAKVDSQPVKRYDPKDTASQTFDAIPGQFGPGATRDLAPEEIRDLQPSYAPRMNGEPDPGEVVWTWVPYVENDGRGKDRPVLIIARLSAGAWAACYLSTKHHDGFVSIGTGAWDSKGRESFLAPQRVFRITDSGMRRESAGIDRSTFERAVAAVLRTHAISPLT